MQPRPGKSRRTTYETANLEVPRLPEAKDGIPLRVRP